MNAFDAFGRFFGVSIVGFMAVGAVAIVLYNLAHRDRPKPLMTESCPAALFLSVAGLLSFLAGIVLLGFDIGEKHPLWGYSLACGGFLASGGGILLNAATAKAKRATWPVVSARCTDRQLQMKVFSNGDGSWDGWLWSLVCDIDYGGRHYVVTPKVRWSDTSQGETPFRSEDEAKKCLAQMVSAHGECKLRINPKNPLEAELLS